MKYILNCILLFCCTMQADAQYLDQFVWENRLIIIFENNDRLSEKTGIQERSLLHRKSDLIDRKLKVFRYNGSTLKTVFPEQKTELNIDLGIHFQSNYETILIGLDGSIKARFSSIKSPDWVFDFIDSMPMRQSELKRKKKE